MSWLIRTVYQLTSEVNMKPAKKKPMNKWLKGGIYFVAITVVFIALLFFICNGLLDCGADIAKDLGVKEL